MHIPRSAEDPSTVPGREQAADAAARLISERFLDRLVVVHIPDGRAFRGTLLCIDNGVNVILNDTVELRTLPNDASSTLKTSLPVTAALQSSSSVPGPNVERNVGMVMVPGHHVVKIEVEQFPGASNSSASQPVMPFGYQPAAFGWPEDLDMYT